MDRIQYRPVGIIHTPFQDLTCMPVQPAGARGVHGEIVINPEYTSGLNDLEGFSRIIVIYHFHQVQGYALHIIPFLDTVPRGLFATRTPCRPNPIGLSVLRMVCREDSILRVMDVDIADGTPVLDIKPYIPDFDSYPDERCGWMSGKSNEAGWITSDDRFSNLSRYEDKE